METASHLVALADIDDSSENQPRTDGLNKAHVESLKATGPETWPPLDVIPRGGRFILVDGFHRLKAAKDLVRTEIDVNEIDAPKDADVRGLAFQANPSHGLLLTLGDRKAEAKRLLHLTPDAPERVIAKRCGLDDKTVAKVRGELVSTAELPQLAERRGADGKTRPVKPSASTRGAAGGSRSSPSHERASTDPELTRIRKAVDALLTRYEYADERQWTDDSNVGELAGVVESAMTPADGRGGENETAKKA